MNTPRNLNKMQEKCKDLKDFHVIITLKDGSKFDGIILLNNIFNYKTMINKKIN